MIVATFVAAAASFAVLAAMFVPLERVFAARAGQRLFRAEWVTDACFFAGQYFVWSLAAAALLEQVRVPLEVGGLMALPFAVKIAIAVLGGDFVVYWFHRACHRFEPLWRFHAVHHSAPHLDWVAAHREHPVDGVLTQLCANLPAFLVGLPLEALAGLAAFRGMWGIFVHSNVRIALGPLRVLLGAPELHHWHHARSPQTKQNFANLAPWLDVLFGTYHCPRADERYELGIEGEPSRGYVGHLAAPFAAKGIRARLARIATAGVFLSVSPGCREQAATDSHALDARGCIAEPATPSASERGPFPFETCRPSLADQPAMVLDQQRTAERRATAARACCYTKPTR